MFVLRELQRKVGGARRRSAVFATMTRGSLEWWVPSGAAGAQSAAAPNLAPCSATNSANFSQGFKADYSIAMNFSFRIILIRSF